MTKIEVPDIQIFKNGVFHSLRNQKIFKNNSWKNFVKGSGFFKDGNWYVLNEGIVWDKAALDMILPKNNTTIMQGIKNIFTGKWSMDNTDQTCDVIIKNSNGISERYFNLAGIHKQITVKKADGSRLMTSKNGIAIDFYMEDWENTLARIGYIITSNGDVIDNMYLTYGALETNNNMLGFCGSDGHYRLLLIAKESDFRTDLFGCVFKRFMPDEIKLSDMISSLKANPSLLGPSLGEHISEDVTYMIAFGGEGKSNVSSNVYPVDKTFLGKIQLFEHDII